MRIPATEQDAILQFKPYVIKTAKCFERTGVNRDDLIQTGLAALLVAFRLWRPDGGANLLTWIRRPIRNAMTKLAERHMRADGRGAGRKASLYREGVHLCSLEAIVPDTTLTLQETIGSFEEPPDYLALGLLPRAMSTLKPNERAVIRHRFIDGWTLSRTGRQLGLTRQRISQIENAALRKLRKLVIDKGLPS